MTGRGEATLQAECRCGKRELGAEKGPDVIMSDVCQCPPPGTGEIPSLMTCFFLPFFLF